MHIWLERVIDRVIIYFELSKSHFFRCILYVKNVYKWECDLESSKCLDLSSQNVGWEIVEEHKFLQCYQM